ncbi:putative lipase YDR444W [Rutidosis leptorrhynchoides]|uniref:putative lipase YDR444W n=1 Tax=Rutidosis leptorrhynchoides TaxID=125765 RepID=UPI003A99EF1B
MFAVTTKPQFLPLNLTSFNPGFQFGQPKFLLSASVPSSSEMDLIPKLGKLFFISQHNKTNQIIDSDNINNNDDDDVVSDSNKVQPDHLVIMVNGIIGSATDWGYAAKQFVKRLPDKVIVHCSECNSATLTFDGVDRMGERLAEEVLAVAQRWPKVSKISFVAHSLGGLVARYAIGRLYECSSNEAKIAGLQPVNFITVATPHLGSRGHRQLPLLCGLSFLERSASQTAHWIAGRSGKHLFLTDNDDGELPLLIRMVNDSKDIKFISALGSFKRRVAYANANYDHMVGWETSSIRRQHELPNPNLLSEDDKYPHIVYIERDRQEGSVAVQEATPSAISPENFEEAMIRGLTQKPWERVDVSFQKSTQRYIAHSTIQVKTYWLNSDGADVVLHMIDNFQL